MKTLTKLLTVLALSLAALSQPITASALGGPVFDYPVDGQTLDLEGSYLFRVHPVPSAQGYLWGFFQNGVMVWENWRDEGILSGNEYGIHPGTIGHTKFVQGEVEVWVRAWVDNQWTDATVITIHLQPRAVIRVSIDINPGGPNKIRPKSMQRLEVVILSASGFDAPAMVDRASLTFGRTGDEQSLAGCKRKVKDVNRDKLPDLICEFRIRAALFQAGDTVGILKGMTVDGFPITGSDTIKVVR